MNAATLSLRNGLLARALGARPYKPYGRHITINVIGIPLYWPLVEGASLPEADIGFEA